MKKLLLHLAREAIREVLEERVLIDRSALIAEYPQLAERQATFVTLNLHGALRGCIGSLVAHRPLLDDLIENARAAAFRDPRFAPLSAQEFLEVTIEVSLLSPPEALPYTSIDALREKVVAGKDGIILRHQGRQATFLPQVWEELPSFDAFFEQLCRKAGLSSQCLQEHPMLERYRVEKFAEGDDGL